MLIYHPAYDAYHCLFRMIAIIERTGEVEIDKLKILDFYIQFPFLLSRIRMPRPFGKIKRDAKRIYNEYHDPLNSEMIFKEMRHIHDAAIKCMLAAGYIYSEKFNSGYVVRTGKKVPENLTLEMKEFLDKKEPFSSFVVQDLAELPLAGPDGLKSRTQLMEYRYDIY